MGDATRHVGSAWSDGRTECPTSVGHVVRMIRLPPAPHQSSFLGILTADISGPLAQY